MQWRLWRQILRAIVRKYVIIWCSTHTVSHINYTHTRTQTLACRQTQNSLLVICLPVRDQKTSILRCEFVKMFQEVLHHHTRVSMMKVINPIDWPVPQSLQGLQSSGRLGGLTMACCCRERDIMDRCRRRTKWGETARTYEHILVGVVPPGKQHCKSLLTVEHGYFLTLYLEQECSYNWHKLTVVMTINVEWDWVYSLVCPYTWS